MRVEQKKFRLLFGEHLRELRGTTRFSQRDIAERLGVSVSVYSNWESGKTLPSLYYLSSLAWVFKVDSSEIVYWLISHEWD